MGVCKKEEKLREMSVSCIVRKGDLYTNLIGYGQHIWYISFFAKATRLLTPSSDQK